MKRTAALLIIIVTIFMLFGCNRDVPEESKATEATASPTPTPSPKIVNEEEIKLSPADMLGDALNPFYSLTLPNGFSIENIHIFRAGQDKNGEDLYQYSMDIFTPLSDETLPAVFQMLGITDANLISGYTDTFASEQTVKIEACTTADGFVFNCDVSASPKADRYDLALFGILSLADGKEFAKFFEDNLNFNLFDGVNEYAPLLPLSADFEISLFYVDIESTKDTPKVTLSATYPTDDIDKLQQDLTANAHYAWANDPSFGFDYGEMSGQVWLDKSSGTYSITQYFYSIPDTPLSEYVYVHVDTMQDYGMGFDPESGTSLIESHGETYSSLAFHTPAWGGDEEGEQLHFFCTTEENESILILYIASEAKYFVQIEKDKQLYNYAYDTNQKTFIDYSPSREAVDSALTEMFGEKEQNERYCTVFREMEQFTNDYMNISFEALVSLAPAEGYLAMPALPSLPVPGEIRTTLESIGFSNQLETDNLCIYIDEEGKADLHISSEDWMHEPEEWSQNCMTLFLFLENNRLEITYYPLKQMYSVDLREGASPEENAPSSHFTYYANTGKVTDLVSSGMEKKVEAYLSEVLGLENDEAIFGKVAGILDEYTANEFGMTPDALFETPLN